MNKPKNNKMPIFESNNKIAKLISEQTKNDK